MPEPICELTDDLLESMFTEPADFRPKSPEPTIHQVTVGGKLNFKITLVGKHSLWGHWIWNAGMVAANYIHSNQDMFKNRRVLELGAGAMLPSLVSAISGASIVVSTDYPESSLLDTMQHNANLNVPDQVLNGCLKIEGYLWGTDPTSLTAHLSENELFDVIIMADLIFNHTQHEQLVKTVVMLLSKREASRVLVTFTHHNPTKFEKDLEFFKIAQANGLLVEKGEESMHEAMFKDDVGDLKMRQTVHFYNLKWR